MKKRLCSAALAVMMLVLTAIPMNAAHAATSGMVRIALTSMGLPTSVTINISGSYSIPEKPSVTLASGKSYTISYKSGQLYINVNGSDVAMGSSFTIKRHIDSSGNAGYISLNNVKYGTRSYMGDMIFRGNEGYVRMISRLYIEDYLYGVVPHEMNNLFPVEALKSQAIAARSYAAKRIKGSSSVYDLSDTTSDQVYKGYSSKDDVAIRAVNETRGMVLTYNGAIIDAYYSASNGGQTEDPNNMWFGEERAPACYVIKDDPYDLRNPLSSSIITTVSRDGRCFSPSMSNLIITKALAQLGSSYNQSASTAQIVSISGFQLTNARNISSSNSRYYRDAQMNLRVRATRNDGYQEERDVSVTMSLHDEVKPNVFPNEDLRLFSLTDDGYTWTLTLARYGHGAGLSQRGAEQMANEGMNVSQILGFYFVGANITTMDYTSESMTTYTGGGSSSGGSVSSSAIAQGTVSVSSSLTVRKSASTSASKLGTLSNGSSVDIVEKLSGWYGIVYGSTTGYVSADYIKNVTDINNNTGNTTDQGSTSTGNTGNIIMIGTVVLADASTTLSVRQTKSDLSAAIGALGNGQRVEIYESDAGFYTILYNGMTGYVSTGYVAITEIVSPGTTPQPTSQVQETITVYATGTVSATSLNIRNGPAQGHDLIGTVANGATFELIGSYNGWYRIRYNGSVIGWVMASYVTASATVPETGYNNSSQGSTGGTVTTTAAPTPTPVPVARTGKVNTNGAKSVTVYSFPDGSEFDVLTNGTAVKEVEARDGWSRVEAKDLLGWIKTEFITFDGGTSSSTNTTNTGSTSTSSSTMKTTTAVHLRAGASTSYKSFGVVSKGTSVTIVSKGSDWTKVTHKQQTGYIMTKYLK